MFGVQDRTTREVTKKVELTSAWANRGSSWVFQLVNKDSALLKLM